MRFSIVTSQEISRKREWTFADLNQSGEYKKLKRLAAYPKDNVWLSERFLNFVKEQRVDGYASKLASCHKLPQFP